MESHKIEKLMAAYFEGKTSLSEERELKEYFTSGDVAAEYESYRPLFQYMVVAKNEQSQRTFKIPSGRRLNLAWASVAAAVVVAFGIYFGQSYQEQKQAEMAYQETKRAISLLAENLERGNKKIVYLQGFEETTQKIYKNN